MVNMQITAGETKGAEWVQNLQPRLIYSRNVFKLFVKSSLCTNDGHNAHHSVAVCIKTHTIGLCDMCAELKITAAEGFALQTTASDRRLVCSAEEHSRECEKEPHPRWAVWGRWRGRPRRSGATWEPQTETPCTEESIVIREELCVLHVVPLLWDMHSLNPPHTSYCMLYIVALKNSTQHCDTSYPSYLCCIRGMG